MPNLGIRDAKRAYVCVGLLALDEHLKYLVLFALPLLLAQEAVEHALAIAVGIAGISAELKEEIDDLGGALRWCA